MQVDSMTGEIYMYAYIIGFILSASLISAGVRCTVCKEYILLLLYCTLYTSDVIDVANELEWAPYCQIFLRHFCLVIFSSNTVDWGLLGFSFIYSAVDICTDTFGNTCEVRVYVHAPNESVRLLYVLYI